MNSSYCLNQEVLELFIENNLYGKEIDDSNIKALIEDAKNWDAEAIGLTYFLGRIIQKKIKHLTLPDNYVHDVFSLKESIYFGLNELDVDFMKYILFHDRLIEEEYSLDDILDLLHASYTEKDYGRIIRY